MRSIALIAAAGLLFGLDPAPAGGQASGSAALPQVAANTTDGADLLTLPARLRVREAPLAQGLMRLHESSGVALAFSPSLLPRDQRVTCRCQGTTVGEALDRLLAGTDFRYAVVGEQVVIEQIGTLAEPVLGMPPTPIRFASVGPSGAINEDEAAPAPAAEAPQGALARVGSLLSSLFTEQQGSITGEVVADRTEEPLSGVQIFIEGTAQGTVTDQNGRYLLVNVPSGTHTLVARYIGYANGREDNVRVRSEQSTTVDFRLRTQALSLEEVVVTGVVDPVAGIKAPFSVGRLSAQDLEVPTTHSAVANLQGKVPGVNIIRPSGQPGSGVFVQLRSPTSMVRSNTPMFVVDGVILSGVAGSTVDLESLDIESIEVIKGAAAAALYGSRAASGVVQITTARGSAVPQGETRITSRSEIGYTDLPQGLPLSDTHYYLTDESGGFIDEAGNAVTDSRDRVIAPDRIMDKPYGVPLFDNVRAFYRPGGFRSNSISLGHNSGDTNFALSVNDFREKGTIVTNDGYRRTNVRINLDHRLRDDLSLATSAYHNRSYQDELSGSPFWDLLMYPPDVDLSVRDESGNYIQQPDPLVYQENPIWRQTSRDNYNQRARTLLSGQARYRPFNWLSVQGNVSYDRSDRHRNIYVPKGTPFVSSTDDDAASDGQLTKTDYNNNALNASVGATILQAFGDLTTRTTLHALMEREDYTVVEAEGFDFLVKDVPRLDVARRQFTESYTEDIRSDGYFVNTGLDYAGKYIADLLVRRDGSSLFGPDARWSTYYRASGAYRMAEEPWWPFPALTEFKLRASQGTAGGRPNFADRFETWSVSSDGSVSKGTLGNRRLRPEKTTEREFGLDVIAVDRYQLQLTYAWQRTEDQIIQIPQPAVTGYSNQWQNSGTIEGRAWEASLEAILLSRGSLNWTSTLVADRVRSEFTEWNRVCYVPSAGYTYRCLGMNHTQFYGERFLTSPDELPAIHAGSGDAFSLNDDGYMVAVGAGGDWREPRWGEFVEIDGITYKWGHPVLEVDENGNPELQVIGEGYPDFTLGWGNRLRVGGLSLYGLLHSQVGGDVYNRTKQRLYQHFRHADLDQSGKPQEAKKPIEYYQTLYEANNVNSHFVEPGGYLKLRELSVRYSFGEAQLQRFGLGRLGTERLSIGVIGRNLWTRTDYTGFDPEVGTERGFIRRDNFSWPHTRTVTANVEITF